MVNHKTLNDFWNSTSKFQKFVTLPSIKTFSTDCDLSRNARQLHGREIGPHQFNGMSESEVLTEASKLMARVVVRTSVGSWYIKGISTLDTYSHIENLLTRNENKGLRPKSTS